MEDNEVIDETDYLLQSPVNVRRLLESIEEVEKASIKEVTINSL
jgi:PHD/YefM family antitoxin component YafN of YafNO toxin-antitoxin module